MKRMMLACLLLIIGSASAVTTSGWYQLSDLRVYDLPPSKANGSAWDPLGGAPDVMVSLQTDMGDGVYDDFTTRVVSDVTTSASWATEEVIAVYTGIDSPSLYFTVTDHDISNHDPMDCGSIYASELSTTETNLVRCEYGTKIEFSLEFIEETVLFMDAQ